MFGYLLLLLMGQQLLRNFEILRLKN